VLFFALLGILFDVTSLTIYHYYGGAESESDQAAGEESSTTCGINVVMCAALLHIISDLMRSTTTLIESLVILNDPDIPSSEADGYATLFVCSVVLVGTLGALYTWFIEVKTFVTEYQQGPEAFSTLEEEEQEVNLSSAVNVSSRSTKSCPY